MDLHTFGSLNTALLLQLYFGVLKMESNSKCAYFIFLLLICQLNYFKLSLFHFI